MSDDEFIRWDIQYLPEPTGFPNFGNTCYLNSMLQTLISCPAIMQVLKTIENTNPEQYQNNPIVNSLLNLWKKTLDKTAVADDVKSFWRAMLIVARSKNDRVKIDMGGQQDPHEGLMMCLDAFEHIPKLRRLFEHRHQTDIICSKCGHSIQKKQENVVFEVQPNLSTEQDYMFSKIDPYYKKKMSMQEFLKMQNTFVDGFKCPKCEDTGKKFMSTRLTMVPEILIVLFKKYEVVKSYTEFPLELTFDTRVGNTLKYNLVAQCEHVGSFSMAGGSGGHYYAICARKVEGETMAFQLNDSHCSPAELKATQNTYMAVYHIQ